MRKRERTRRGRERKETRRRDETDARTFGDGIIKRSSPSNCFSSPPLKKNVTCAYLSVSEIAGASGQQK
jgi:hypothetical protein